MKRVMLGMTMLAGCVLAAVPGKKFESMGAGLLVRSFVPTVADGVYAPGDDVTLRMTGEQTNGTSQATLSMVDFNGTRIETGVTQMIPAGKFSVLFRVKAPKSYGHFTVQANLTREGKGFGYTQTAFVTAPGMPTAQDPFFMVDKNGAVIPLVRCLQRLGFGSLSVSFRGIGWASAAKPEDIETYFAGLTGTNRNERFRIPGLKLRGMLDPDVKRYAHVQKRVQEGLSPVSDEDLRKARALARRTAEAVKDVVQDWFIQEEFDSIFAIPKHKDSYVHYMSAYALIVRQYLEGLKEGNPNCRVGVLGICCEDYMNFNPPFPDSKKVLASLRGRFDYVALDAYTGGWNALVSPYRPPEILLRKLLKDGAALSEAYGGQKIAANAERSHALDYCAALDSQMCHDQAVMTARSMIVNRAVMESPYYGMHLATYPERADAFWRKRAQYLVPGAGLYDLGIWKPVHERIYGADLYVPRPGVPAAGTVARELAFVTDGTDHALADGMYACCFSRVADGKPVAALWTTNSMPAVLKEDVMGDPQRFTQKVMPVKTRKVLRPVIRQIVLDLDAGGRVTDLMGNARRFERGRLTLTLNDAPQFIRYDGARKELEEKILACRPILENKEKVK